MPNGASGDDRGCGLTPPLLGFAPAAYPPFASFAATASVSVDLDKTLALWTKPQPASTDARVRAAAWQAMMGFDDGF